MPLKLPSRRLAACFFIVLATLLLFLAIQPWRQAKLISSLGSKSLLVYPGVYMIRGIGPSVAYAIESSDGLILIDSGLDSDAAALKLELASFLLDWREVKAVLLTHVHGDHCGGAEYFRESTRAKIHAGQGDAESDTVEREHDGDKDVIKAGPFIAEFTLGSEKIISTITIPPGTYDHIKFEIHKLNEHEDQSLLNDPLFGDFVNGGRYTFIIDGISYVNGIGYPFTFKSSQTDNVTFFFEPPVLFDANHAYDLTLKFDPKLMFGRPGMKPLDPRETDNRHDIEKLLRSAIKALRTPK